MRRDVRGVLRAGAAVPSRPVPTGELWQRGRRWRSLKLTAAASVVVAVLGSAVAAAGLFAGVSAPEILGGGRAPLPGPTSSPTAADHGEPVAEPLGPGGPLHCTGVLDMTSEQAAVLLADRGYELEWRFSVFGATVMTPDPERNQPGAIEGYTAVRETRPEGIVRDVILYEDGTALVFVNAADDPINDHLLYPPDYLCSGGPRYQPDAIRVCQDTLDADESQVVAAYNTTGRNIRLWNQDRILPGGPSASPQWARYPDDAELTVCIVDDVIMKSIPGGDILDRSIVFIGADGDSQPAISARPSDIAPTDGPEPAVPS